MRTRYNHLTLEERCCSRGLMEIGLGMVGCAADMFHALIIDPFGQVAGNIAGPIVVEQPLGSGPT